MGVLVGAVNKSVIAMKLRVRVERFEIPRALNWYFGRSMKCLSFCVVMIYWVAFLHACFSVLGTAANNVMTSHGHTNVALEPRLFLHRTFRRVSRVCLLST